MKLKCLFILFFFLLVLSSFSLAQTNIIVTPIDNEITTVEEASFEVEITNNHPKSRTYTLYGLDVVWDINPDSKKFTLMPRSSRTINVGVRPLGPFKPSAYTMKLYVDSSLAPDSTPINRYKVDLPVVLYPQTPTDYLPAIRTVVDMENQVNPQIPLTIRLFLENRNPLDLSGLNIRIQSDMPEFVKEATVDIEPHESKTIEFEVTPNPIQPPKDYVLFFMFERGGETVKMVDHRIEIMTMQPAFIIKSVKDTVLFKKHITMTVTNDGNILNTQRVKIPASLMEALFASGEKEVINEEGQRYLVWEATLSPQESTTIKYAINYRLIFYLLLLVIAFLVFYLTVRSPAELSKRAHTVKSGEHGALSEVKITLELKNLTKRRLKHVKIIDMVPGIANVEKCLHLGTLKPEEIRHTQKGAKVIWNLAEVEPHEHRLITYNIKAKLNILGILSLPRATLTYAKRGGKHGKVFSNIYRLGR